MHVQKLLHYRYVMQKPLAQKGLKSTYLLVYIIYIYNCGLACFYLINENKKFLLNVFYPFYSNVYHRNHNFGLGNGELCGVCG